MNKEQISLQVYSARNFKPYDNIFNFLSEQGMQNVELFEVEAFDETKDLLEKYDLTAKSSHIRVVSIRMKRNGMSLAKSYLLM